MDEGGMMMRAVFAVVVLAAGASFADLTIERECDADEGRGKDGFFVVSRGADDPVTKPIGFNLGACWVTTNVPRRLTSELPPANPIGRKFPENYG